MPSNIQLLYRNGAFVFCVPTVSGGGYTTLVAASWRDFLVGLFDFGAIETRGHGKGHSFP